MTLIGSTKTNKKSKMARFSTIKGRKWFQFEKHNKKKAENDLIWKHKKPEMVPFGMTKHRK
jgi:hypothetical protein